MEQQKINPQNNQENNNVTKNDKYKVNTDKRVIRTANIRVVVLGIIIFIIASFVLAGKVKLILIPEQVSKILSSLIVIIGSYFLASVFVRITLNKVIDSIESSTETKLLITKLYSAGIFLLVTTVVLWELGVTIQNIALIVGLMATGLAFAVRDIILSYLVWFVVLKKKPFRIGDYIRIGEDEGRVIHIGTFFVLLDDTPDKKEDFVRVPNKLFLEKSVRNFGNKQIQDSVKIKIQNPKNIDNLIKNLRKKLKDVAINLETNNEGIWIKADYSVSVEERKKEKTNIITTILKEIEKIK